MRSSFICDARIKLTLLYDVFFSMFIIIKIFFILLPYYYLIGWFKHSDLV